MSSKQNQKRVFIGFLLGLFTLLLFILKPFFMPIILGSILVLLFYPLYNWFLKLSRGHAYLASFLSTFSITVFIFLPAALIASLVTNQIFSLVDQAVQFVDKARLLDNVQQWNNHIQYYVDKMEQTFHIQFDLRSVIANGIKQFAYYVYQYSPAVLGRTLSFFVEGFIMLIVVFFLFVEASGLYQELIRLSPIEDKHERTLAHEMKSMVYAVVYGSFITALVQGFMAVS